MDEYTVDNSSKRHKQMALRLCLTADRTRMRELCVFPTHLVSLAAVLKRLIRPAVRALEAGVLMHLRDDGAAAPVVGSLYGMLGDMLARWQALSLNGLSSVLSNVRRYEWLPRLRANTVTVRSLPAMVPTARAAHLTIRANDGRIGRAKKVLTAMQMNWKLPLPELFHHTYKLLQSSIYRFGPCSMHQWTGLYELVTLDICNMLSWEQLELIDKVMSGLTWKTLNLPGEVFYAVKPKRHRREEVDRGGGTVFKAYRMTSQQWQDFFAVLPDVLLCLDVGEAPTPTVAKCLKLVLALLQYLDVIEEVRAGAVVEREEWRARARAKYAAFIDCWHAARRRPLRRLKSGVEYVGVRPKLFDESLTADVICHTGPIHELSTRRGEQQHQFGKFISHHRSQRRDNVGLSVQNARSLREQVGGAAELRKRKTPAHSGVVPLKTDALPYIDMPDWLANLGVLKATACVGLHMFSHLLDLHQFVHIVKRDGDEVWGSLDTVTRVDLCHHPINGVPVAASGSSWIVEVKEFDLVPSARFPTQFKLTPCNTQSRNELIRVIRV